MKTIWISPVGLGPYDTTRQTHKVLIEQETETEFIGRNADWIARGIIIDPVHYPKFAWEEVHA